MSDVTRLREAMLALYRQVGELQRQEICCRGVTVPQCHALQLLDLEGEMTAGDLAARLGVDASTMTRAADVLVRNGAIERARPESGDRRRVILRLTGQGAALAERLVADGDACFEVLLEQFPREERAGIVRALGQLTATIDRMRGRCGAVGAADQAGGACCGEPRERPSETVSPETRSTS